MVPSVAPRMLCIQDMKTILIFVLGLLVATAWAQIDAAHGIMWLPSTIGSLNGHGYQMGLRNDGVVIWRWYPPLGHP
jgi:hypothetical protein